MFSEISIAFQLFDISETKTIAKIVLNHFSAIVESITMKQNRKNRIDVFIINFCLLFEDFLLNIIFDSIVPLPCRCYNIVLAQDFMYQFILLPSIFIFVTFSHVISLPDYI